MIGGVIQKSGNRVVTKAGSSANFCFETAVFAPAYTGNTISGYVGRDYIGAEQCPDFGALNPSTNVTSWGISTSIFLLGRGGAAADTVYGYRSPTGSMISAVTVSSGFWVAGARISGSNYYLNTDGVETTGSATSGAFDISQIVLGSQETVSGGGGAQGLDSGGLVSEAVMWFSDIGTSNLNAVVANCKAFMAS